MTEVAQKKHFYVSAINGSKKYLVAGPYSSHGEALTLVNAVRDYAETIDDRAYFMAWGTAGNNTPTKTPLGAWSPKDLTPMLSR